MWIMSVKDTGSRLLRWRIKLEEYDYEIVFKKGIFNTNVDALSRISSLGSDQGVTEEKRQQIADDETRTTILYKYHDSPI